MSPEHSAMLFVALAAGSVCFPAFKDWWELLAYRRCVRLVEDVPLCQERYFPKR